MMDGLGALSMGWAYFARLFKDQAGARRRQHHHQAGRTTVSQEETWREIKMEQF